MNNNPSNLPPGYIHPTAGRSAAPSQAGQPPQPQLPFWRTSSELEQFDQQHQHTQLQLSRLRDQLSSRSPVQNNPTHFAPPVQSVPVTAPPGQDIWYFPPLQIRPQIISMSEQNNPTQSTNHSERVNPSPFRGRQGNGGYIATPVDKERQATLMPPQNASTGFHEIAGDLPDHRGQLLASSSVHESPYTILRPGQPRMLSPPPELRGGPSASYQVLSPDFYTYLARSQGQGQPLYAPSLGGSHPGSAEQHITKARRAGPGEPAAASRKRFAEGLDESDKEKTFSSATAMPTPAPKKQKSTSNKPSASTSKSIAGKVATVNLEPAPKKSMGASKQPRVVTAAQTGRKTVPFTKGKPTLVPKEQMTTSEHPSLTTLTQTGRESVVPPFRKSRASGRETAAERDEPYREEVAEKDEAINQDTPLPSIEGGGGNAAKNRVARAIHRKTQKETAVPAAAAQAQAQSRSRFAAATHPVVSTYYLSNTLERLRRVLGEPNWQQFLHLVEQYVDGTIDESHLIRDQRRIFHGQNQVVEKKCRRLTEKMVREARDAQGGV
ncbi:hypothetical protein PMIN07_006608 [Paraphaeosphaeria minitans]